MKEKLERLYRRQQGFAKVRDYYRVELGLSLISRNLPLPKDDTDLFNNWLSLYQESTQAHSSTYGWNLARTEFHRQCMEVQHEQV